MGHKPTLGMLGLVVVLVWVYYNAILVLFGAELTRAYAAWLGERVKPEAYAMPEQPVPDRPPAPPPDCAPEVANAAARHTTTQ